MVENSLSDTHVAMCEIRYRQGPSTDQVARSASRNGGAYYGGIKPNFNLIDHKEQSDLRKMTVLRNNVGNPNSGAGNVKCRGAVYFVQTGRKQMLCGNSRERKQAGRGGGRGGWGSIWSRIRVDSIIECVIIPPRLLKERNAGLGAWKARTPVIPTIQRCFRKIRYAGTPPTHRPPLPPILAILAIR